MPFDIRRFSLYSFFVKIYLLPLYLKKCVVIGYNTIDRPIIINLVRKVGRECDLLITENEAYQICMAVNRTKKIKGDIAEVGVYKGGSAKLICNYKGNKTLHLFDTFEGLPELSKHDCKKQFKKGMHSAIYMDTKKYLSEYRDVHFYKGYFPDTAAPIYYKKFSFVNLDADLYDSTLDSLKFFYPRMNKGGIIIVHDYYGGKGVMKAVDEFFIDKTEPVIELSGTQCLIVKV